MATTNRPQVVESPLATSLRVSGTISDAGGNPVAGVIVAAYDRDLRSAQLLGKSTITSGRGRYEIFYGPDDFSRAEKAAADVFIEVSEGKEGGVQRSNVVYNAHRDLTIDLRLADSFFRDAEFGRLVHEVTRFTAREQVSIAELESANGHDDIAFLSAELAVPAIQIVHLVLAHRLEREAEGFAEFFYALLRTDALLTPSRDRLHAIRLSIDLDADVPTLLNDIVLLSEKTAVNAVKQAARERIVGDTLPERVGTILEHLAGFRNKAHEADQQRARRELLELVGRSLDAGSLAAIAAVLSDDHLGRLPDLIERVHATLSMRTEKVSPETLAALEMARSFGTRSPVLDIVRDHLGVRDEGDVRVLAGLDEAGWQQQLSDAAERGRLGKQRPSNAAIRNEARRLTREFTRRFPSAAFTLRLARGSEGDAAVRGEAVEARGAAVAHGDLIARVFHEHPELDLRTTNIDSFLRQRKGASRQENDALRGTLKAAQRLYRLAPTEAHARVLHVRGLTNAARVAGLTRGAFVQRVGGQNGLTKVQAERIYERASAIHAGTQLLAGELRTLGSAMDTGSISAKMSSQQRSAWAADFPNMRTLFAGQDICECKECRSVFSPAAYLADVFQFLKECRVLDTTAPGAPASTGARDALFARRPDLPLIDLDCDNAFTPLPYIDIVNELLEELVAPDPGFGFAGPVAAGAASIALVQAITAQGLPVGAKPLVNGPDANGGFTLRAKDGVYALTPAGGGGFTIRRSRQTHGSEAERAAAPEYVNNTAYQRLANSNIAFQLPFDAAQREVAAIFAKLDLDRSDLMRALAQGGVPSTLAIAAEELGVPLSAATIITTSDATAARQEEFWNVPAGAAVNTLQNVRAFLDRTGLEYGELDALLDVKFIDNADVLFIRHLDSSCDTAQKEIHGLDLAALDRLHRFLRLKRATGLNLVDLNLAIRFAPGGGGALDAAAFERLAHVHRLARRTGRAMGDLLWTWGPGQDGWNLTVYNNLFANPANPSAAVALAFAEVTANEARAAAARTTIAASTGPIGLALGRAPTDVDTLRSFLPDDDLSFANLGRLLAMSTAARLARLSVPACAALRRLSAIDPALGPADMWSFLDVAETLAAVRLDPVAAESLLVFPASPDPRIPSDADVTTILQRLQATLVNARVESRPSFAGTDPVLNAPILLDVLARMGDLDPATIGQVENLTRGRWTFAEAAPAFLNRVFGPLLPPAVLAAVLAAWAVVPGGNPDTKTAERNAFILALGNAIGDVLYERARREAAVTLATRDLRIEETVARVLLSLGRLKAVVAVAGVPLGDVFTDPALITPLSPLPAVTKAAFGNAYAAVKLLAVMGIASGTLRLDRRQVEWLLANAVAAGMVELDTLPYEAALGPVTFASLLAWARARRIDDTYPAAESPDTPGAVITILDVMSAARLAGATVASLRPALVAITGWEAANITDLAARFGFNASQLVDPLNLGRVSRAMEILKLVGVSVSDGVTIAKNTLAAADAAVARAALRVRYGDADWLITRKAIENRLREHRRDALVAYLTATDARFRSSLDLFDYLLTNVDMAPCQPTSRIVHAHGTVQLFVERCLMGIEPTTVADTAGDSHWKRWEWLRNYRVSEAQRRVFVHTESYIEPALLDNKSSFFKDVEKALMQGELTDRLAEDAMQGYLEQLDDVAFLEQLACYYHVPAGTMHLFARTRGGDPATFYYRRFVKEREWTPWEKVDLDITADHLIPFVRNNRLCLAWPVFEEEAEPRDDGEQVPAAGGPGVKSPPPNKRLRIRLAVSEYVRGAWLPKKLSKEGFVSGSYVPRPPDPSVYRFLSLDLGPAGFSVVITERVDSTGKDDYFGAFAVTGCKGYPEPTDPPSNLYFGLRFLPAFKDARMTSNRARERGRDATNDFALFEYPFPGWEQQLLANTPDGNALSTSLGPRSGNNSATFKVASSQHMTGLDKLLSLVALFLTGISSGTLKQAREYGIPMPLGTLLPFMFEDRNRAYVIIPGWFGRRDGIAGGPPIEIAHTSSDFMPLFDDILDRLVYAYQSTIGTGGTVVDFLVALISDQDLIDDVEKLGEMFRLQFGYKVANAYHPLVCRFRRALYESGVSGLLNRPIQQATTGFDFSLPASYAPTSLVTTPYPVENVDFRRDGSYAPYNWEVFFHLPFLMAVRLTTQQRFEDARRWFHYIFDPTGSQGGTSPQKYWITQPFFERSAADYAAQRIEAILYAVAQDPAGGTLGPLADAIEDWRDHPFQPHVIARGRSVAYQKAVVMKYIGHLIAHGDYLFRQETMESVTQADQLYVLAEKLLGPKPRTVPAIVEPPPRNYRELEPDLDLFSNALLDLENLVPDPGSLPHGGAELPPMPATLTSLYFCIPPNQQMLDYWATVADRRFKIAHCRTIDGTERTLALFAPRIDPADLVRATAQGLSIGSVLAGLGAPLPPYRFQVMAQKTAEFIAEVRTLGQGLQQALEKRDAEDLITLRGTLELELLDKITDLKQSQIREATESHKALDRAVDATRGRRVYYRTRKTVNELEATAMILQGIAGISQLVASGLSVAAGVVNLLPTFNLGISGFGGSPQVTVTWGSTNIAGGLSSFAGAAGSVAGALNTAGGIVATVAGYERRREEWQFQGDNADREITALNQQIEVAKVREEITAKDLVSHTKQIDNARRIDAFMHSKFTNRELFDWMANEVTSVYFQAYDLAFTMAKKAERCFQHELGTTDRFVQGGSWDSVRKGLGSADRLMHQLRRMEAAYLERNGREYELTKNVSLAVIDPLALLKLKQEGKCTFTIPEAVFDLDHSGHFMRRLKSVALSVPCVAGPYTGVTCKATLLANRYRRSPDVNPQYDEDAGQDLRFVYNVGGVQSIATSQSQNDAGLFELNFRDERYLPFEGCGAVSTWTIEFGSTFRTFDPGTIADVILQLRYTAREGGSGLKTAAEAKVVALLNSVQTAMQGSTGLLRCVDLRHEQSDGWSRLLSTGSATFAVTTDMLPYFATTRTPSASEAWVVFKVKNNPAQFVFDLGGPARTATRDQLVTGYASVKLPNPLEVALNAPFTIASANAANLEEAWLLVKYALV